MCSHDFLNFKTSRKILGIDDPYRTCALQFRSSDERNDARHTKTQPQEATLWSWVRRWLLVWIVNRRNKIWKMNLVSRIELASWPFGFRESHTTTITCASICTLRAQKLKRTFLLYDVSFFRNTPWALCQKDARPPPAQKRIYKIQKI